MIKQAILDQLNDDFISLEQEEVMKLTAIRLSLNLHYQKQKKGIKVYCPVCNEYHKYTDNEFKQIRYTKMCPKCFQEFDKLTQATDEIKHCYNYATPKDNGYQVLFKYKFGKLPYDFNIKLVYKELEGKGYVKGIYIAGQGYYAQLRPVGTYQRWKTNEWRRVYSNSYSWRFFNAYRRKPITKKEYLEKHAYFVKKSNQKEMMMKNNFNIPQLKAIVMFNLKTPEEVYRNRVWISENESNLNNYEMYPSVATLDYLHKNKISMNDYRDYEDLCRKLKRKVDRPKDFWLWHDRLTQMVEVKKNVKFQKGINKVWKKLSERTYQKKDITIKAFESVEEISKVATTLHNCMSRLYVEPYSQGKTELYYLSVDNKPMVAIEIKKGKLIQCRADHNNEPPIEYTRMVKKFVREVVNG